MIGLVQSKRRAGLSVRTCNYIRVTLRALLREGQCQRLVTDNVAAMTDPLPAPKTKPAILTREQARAVLIAAERDSDGPLWVLGLTTGARASEMLGLRWTDVNLDRASITIEQTLQETPKALREEHGRWLVQAPRPRGRGAWWRSRI